MFRVRDSDVEVRFSATAVIVVALVPALAPSGAAVYQVFIESWLETVARFGRRFHHAVGLAEHLEAEAQRLGVARLHGMHWSQTAFATVSCRKMGKPEERLTSCDWHVVSAETTNALQEITWPTHSRAANTSVSFGAFRGTVASCQRIRSATPTASRPRLMTTLTWKKAWFRRVRSSGRTRACS